MGPLPHVTDADTGARGGQVIRLLSTFRGDRCKHRKEVELARITRGRGARQGQGAFAPVGAARSAQDPTRPVSSGPSAVTASGTALQFTASGRARERQTQGRAHPTARGRPSLRAAPESCGDPGALLFPPLPSGPGLRPFLPSRHAVLGPKQQGLCPRAMTRDHDINAPSKKQTPGTRCWGDKSQEDSLGAGGGGSAGREPGTAGLPSPVHASARGVAGTWARLRVSRQGPRERSLGPRHAG